MLRPSLDRYFALFAWLLAGICLLASAPVSAQSTSQNFPTPVTSNEISGTIAARDLGDSRLTTYYYVFEGDTGDVFINVSTRNFTGDVDIFAENGLRPLSKIVIYADLADNETGRVIYMRRPERLLLRVQGRSPGDDPATFRIKFAGSFVALKESSAPVEPEIPKVTAQSDTGIRVNSAGTIIAVTPKPTPAEIAKAEPPPEQAAEKTDEPTPERGKLEVVTTTNIDEAAVPADTDADKPAREKVAARTRRTRRAGAPPPRNTRAAAKPKPAPEAKAEAPDPLASIRLVIEFKDGKLIERPMNEVFKFSVDKGVLTVISRDGSIGRYSILDVAKVTIQ